MKVTLKKIILVLSVLAVLCLIPTLIPYFQTLAVQIVEKLKHDDINDFFWKKQMSAFGGCCLIFILFLNFFLQTKKGSEIWTSLKAEFSNIKNLIIANKKYLLTLIILYLIGYCSILRANFWNYAIDDLPRQMEGSREWVNFYRYISEIGSIFIHTSMKIFDIAPLTQFIAIFFIALASLFLILIFNDKKCSYFLCVAVLPVGLFPYFLSDFSYRYDSPYMAFSVLVSIIPFLFAENLKNYLFISFVSLFLMCTSYQASSGIYVFISILYFLKLLFNNKDKNYLTQFTLSSLGSYIFTLVLFAALFIEQAQGGSYVDESMQLSKLLPNTITYLKTITSGLGKSAVLTFSLLTVLLFIFNSVKNSKINKPFSLIIVIISMIIMLPLTFGSYLALGRPEFIARTFIGIGVFTGAVSLITASYIVNLKSVLLKRVSILVIFALSYSTIAFAFGFGNAEYDQKEYIKFRGTILAKDLSECVLETTETVEILFKNNIGFAPSVKVLNKVYPFVCKTIDTGFQEGRSSQFILESLNFCDLKEQKSHNFINEDYPVLCDNLYNTIQGKDNRYIVTFKNPNLKVVKTRSFYEN